MRKNQYSDLSGNRYGRLIVVKMERGSDSGEYFWLCKCDCGKSKVIRGSDLKRGSTKSCGCLAAENKPPILFKHGASRTALYKVWQAIKDRCLNPNNQSYTSYGGRGVTICSEWMEFPVFQEWAISAGYKKGLDIDRRDNDDSYCPENCRFISHWDNLKNTRRKIMVNVNGESIHLSDVAAKYGFDYKFLWQRYKRGKRGGDLIAPKRT